MLNLGSLSPSDQHHHENKLSSLSTYNLLSRFSVVLTKTGKKIEILLSIRASDCQTVE